jgi:hypothetical protein
MSLIVVLSGSHSLIDREMHSTILEQGDGYGGNRLTEINKEAKC